MENKNSNVMRVPGATLYYEVCGSGPMLLLIHEAGGTARSYDGLVRRLSDHYTIITYDRRGLGHSRLDDPREEPHIEQHSDDAHRLLAELGTDYEAAYVFGDKDGAAIAMDLVARHPEQVYTLVAYEPPTHLPPEAAQNREARTQLGLAALEHVFPQVRIVLASGSECEDESYQNAAAIADQLGVDFIAFPCATTHPREFARQLHRILGTYQASIQA